MTTITADLQFSVRASASANASDAFDLVELPEDQTYLRSALYQPFMSWQQLQAQGNGKYGEALPLARYGVINLRVYCPETVTPELIPLDPIDQEEKLFFFIGLSFLNISSSGYKGKQVEATGRTRTDKIENIRFDGQNRASLKYNYDPGEITILYQTNFLDKDGNIVDPPTLNNQSEFVSDKEIYGALTVRYQPSYARFKVYYDLTGFGVDIEVRGFYSSLKNKRQPSLAIMARYGTQSDLQEFSRDVEDWDFSQINTGSEDFDGTEQSTETVNETKRITNPNDPEDYVDVQRPRVLKFTDKNGRFIYLRMVSQ